jgi:hypothetical protein
LGLLPLTATSGIGLSTILTEGPLDTIASFMVLMISLYVEIVKRYQWVREIILEHLNIQCFLQVSAG